MNTKQENKHINHSPQKNTTKRLSISLPAQDHELLERIASDKKVSLSWVVRDAVRVYLDEDAPLLKEL